MSVLSNLEPERVFYYFEQICNIPHGSYHTKAISDYCVLAARRMGLEVRQDSRNNVVIKKPASAGVQSAPVFMIQGHLDMVCEKEADSNHDFDTEGLKLLIQEDYITAEKTTLGGDDGIAVAIGLAILEDDTIVHPPLEVVFTTEEEVGMEGALNLNPSDLKADYLLNLDSEDEGVLTVSCAGGATQELHLPCRRQSEHGFLYEIRVHGLQGGHSGVEIQKGRANSNIVMSTILTELCASPDVWLVSIDGGFKHNAIPRETKAQIVFPSLHAAKHAKDVIEQYQSLFAEAYRDSDAGINIDMHPSGIEGDRRNQQVFSTVTTQAVLHLLSVLPTGVQAMSQTISGMPETSLNLGVLQTRQDELYVEISSRSSNPSALKLLERKIAYLSQMCGFTCCLQSEYPGWQYRKDSRLRETMVDIYQKMYGKQPVVESIHAGLECGILHSKMPRLDIVSIGPTILDVHTPQERMSISSVRRTYDYILEILRTFAGMQE